MTNLNIPLPSKQQLEWHLQERIMFVCLDPCTWQGREYDNHSLSLSEIKLEMVNTDQWCEVALSWGAKEILFVAKHTGGFCWWQTNTTEYSVKSIPWKNGKGDLLEELSKSCRKYGLNIGIYVYPGDELWGAGIGSGGKTKDPEKQQEYNEIFRSQLRETLEIASKYTKVIEVWFDGSCIIEVGDVLSKYAPDAVILQGPCATIRWVGNESGKLKLDKSWSTVKSFDLKTGLSTQEHSTPDGDSWAPMEVDVTLYNHYWFWAKKKEKKRKTLDELLSIYYSSVGQGAVLLLNSTPNTDGLIPNKDVELYRKFGKELQNRFDNPLQSINNRREINNPIELNFQYPVKINEILISEDISKGERVRKFSIENFENELWNTIFEGNHIGNKHIYHFNEIETKKIRVKIDESIDIPQINFIGAYYNPPVKTKKSFIQKLFKSKGNKLDITKWNRCGDWQIGQTNDDSMIDIDLSNKITKVGTWQIYFINIPDNAIKEIDLLQDNLTSAPGALTKPNSDKPIFNINRTAVITKEINIHLMVKLSGIQSKGDILIRFIS